MSKSFAKSKLTQSILILSAISLLAGCRFGMTKQEDVFLNLPPARLMVKCPQTLPERTDPSLGGGLMNYTEAARIYHSCANKDSDLIDWVDKNVVNKEKQE